MESGDIPRYAYYPYNVNATNIDAIPVVVPTDQVYANENSIASYDIKAADVIVNNGSGKYKLNMRQMVSLIRFEINLTDVQGFGVDEKLVRVELETGAPVSGEYTYSLSNLDGGLTPVSGKQSNSLNITFSAQPSLESMVVAYAVAVPGNQYNKEWRRHASQGRHNASFCPFQPVPDKNRDVHSQKAGSGLGQGDNVGEVLFFQPSFFDNFISDKRDHSITSTDGERSDLGESAENLKVRCHPLLRLNGSIAFPDAKVRKIFEKKREKIWRVKKSPYLCSPFEK